MSAQSNIRGGWKLSLLSAISAAFVVGCGGDRSDEGPATVSPSPLLSCTELATKPSSGLVGNPNVDQTSITASIVAAKPGGPFDAGGSVPPTPAYCNVQFTYGEEALQGPAAGYDIGQKQRIIIRVFLPLSKADGGSGGVQGNWNGKQMAGASGGTSNDHIKWSSYAEGTVGGDFEYAIRLGYVGSNTNAGQANPPYGFIDTGPLAGTLAIGTIEDRVARAAHYGKVQAATISKAYYGSAPTRAYWNGCSGAGNSGLGQLQRFGEEYDGAVIGAPSIYNQQFRLNGAWPALVWKKHIQKGGAIPTKGQRDAATASAIAACDVMGPDNLADGLVQDNRACTFSAAANVCGVPGAPEAPNCLNAAQAAAIDQIWDGPRNKYGNKLWGGHYRGVEIASSTTVAATTTTAMQWNHKSSAVDATMLYADAESLALAGNPPGGITYEDEMTLGSQTVSDYSDNTNLPTEGLRAKGGKIIHVHGTHDLSIRWGHSAEYYRRAALQFSGNGTVDFDKLQSWYRFYPMPGVGHCTGGGPSAIDPFRVLEKWVEKGIEPDLKAIQYPGTEPAGRTRPLCPYPKAAIYKGSGDVNDGANFTCGGNLETQQSVCDMVRAKYKQENQKGLDFAKIGVDPAMCPQLANQQ
ncbi:MAG: tannase/feruloyl esterase family alpha/beta hydrolase [Xanthomonadaceae bacterium]|nr:tannase/feruloyl esterase family alpha/beta hydrolase [Xanthomonadaceae bacterium]